MLPEIVIISFHFGWVFNKVRKMQCEKKIQNKQNKFLKNYRMQAEFWPLLYTSWAGLYLLSPTWGHDGVFNSLYRTCDSVLASRWWILLDFTKTRLEKFPITTRFPTLRCKTEVSRAMEPLDQNGSRTLLQDRNPACKRNLFKSDVRHPWKGSGPLDEESYRQTS